MSPSIDEIIFKKRKDFSKRNEIEINKYLEKLLHVQLGVQYPGVPILFPDLPWQSSPKYKAKYNPKPPVNSMESIKSIVNSPQSLATTNRILNRELVIVDGFSEAKKST